MTRREELVPVICRMREDEGLLWREISERLGLSLSTVHEYYHDPDGDQARARKARSDGVCVDCGGRTVGNGVRAAERCRKCASAGRSREWTRTVIIGVFQWWADEHGEPPRTIDFNAYAARKARRVETAERTERYQADGLIPCHTTVFSVFGSWTAAMVAAGFEPRPAHGVAA